MAKQAKKDKTTKPMGKPKAAKAAKAPKAKAKAVKPGLGHNSERSADAIRSGFNSHRSIWVRLTAEQKAIDRKWTDAKAALKADGYKVLHMQIADDLAGSPKQEAKVHSAVHDRLQVAQWVGHPLGAQLDLFSQPDRTPAVDRAYDEGKQASMENKPRQPPYDPGVPQYQRWLEGYADHQSTLAAGFKPLTERADEPGEGGDDGFGDEPEGWGGQGDPARPLNS